MCTIADRNYSAHFVANLVGLFFVVNVDVFGVDDVAGLLSGPGWSLRAAGGRACAGRVGSFTLRCTLGILVERFRHFVQRTLHIFGCSADAQGVAFAAV